MNAIIVDDTHRKCPYCYAEIVRKPTDTDASWGRRIYCTAPCAAKGNHVSARLRRKAKQRVISGDA